MFKYLIIVEGIADVIFFRDYLIYLNGELEIKDKKLNEKNKEITLYSDVLKIIILESGGFTNLKLIKTRVVEHVDDEYKVLVVQDTDNIDKDHGGIIARMDYLDKEKKEHDIEFETFLFPNHKDDGDLETLLIRIAKKSKYTDFDCCHKSYINCLDSFISGNTITDMKKDKNYIYTYLSLYQGHNVAKEIDRTYVDEYWDFDCDALSNLRGFIEKHSLILHS